MRPPYPFATCGLAVTALALAWSGLMYADTPAGGAVEQANDAMAIDTVVTSPLDGGRGDRPRGDETPPPRPQYQRVTGSKSAGDSAGELVLYEPTYGFTLAYPEGFVVWRKSPPFDGPFTPAPIAWFLVMNPTMASGALAGIEPADLELRVFEIDRPMALQAWLSSVRFFQPDGGTVLQPYAGQRAEGLKLCRSDMLAPGCSVFVLHGRRVYQLSAMSREGEAMIERFAASP